MDLAGFVPLPAIGALEVRDKIHRAIPSSPAMQVKRSTVTRPQHARTNDSHHWRGPMTLE
jgi:hypothetical protein